MGTAESTPKNESSVLLGHDCDARIILLPEAPFYLPAEATEPKAENGGNPYAVPTCSILLVVGGGSGAEAAAAPATFQARLHPARPGPARPGPARPALLLLSASACRCVRQDPAAQSRDRPCGCRSVCSLTSAQFRRPLRRRA